MKKITLLVIILVLTVAGFSFITSPSKTLPRIIINNQTFQLYLAKTPKEREIGLSRYQTLPKDYGMLFLFEKANRPSFWMKNMKFSIDIIFIKGGSIVTIYENIKPPKSDVENLTVYQSQDLSDKVLEINEGLSQKYGFKKGDKVSFVGL